MKYILCVFSKGGLEFERIEFKSSAKAAAEWMLRVSRGQTAHLIVEE